MKHDVITAPEMATYRLVSHHLCPYVQRVAIALAERGMAFERDYIDLADKPQWFREISPLGKVPLLVTEGRVLFESAAILEYLEDTLAAKLHPRDPLTRAEHRGWMEFGSATLNTIAALYAAPDAQAYQQRWADLRGKLERLDVAVGEGPWFGGPAFSVVDTVFAPVFRYFDVFAALELGDPAEGFPSLTAWRNRLTARPSVEAAVTEDYPARLAHFLRTRNSEMGRLIAMNG